MRERYNNNYKFYFRLKKWPVFRDLFFYAISIIALFAFFLDEKIDWYEAVLILGWYGIYAVTLAFNNKIVQKLDACLKTQQEVCFVVQQNKYLQFIIPNLRILII